MSVPFIYFSDFKVPTSADLDLFEMASRRAPLHGDIIISTFPRCGTTLIQHIVFLLLRGGKPADSIVEVLDAIPFPEQDGLPDGVQPMALKYHLPFRLTPFSKDARYIYVARNPKDACVSYYHFLKDLPGYEIKNFDYFYEAFLSGQLPHGDILDHILEWYEASTKYSNIFFTTYESLVKKKEDVVRDLAKFLGLARLDHTTMRNVIYYSSFEYMRSLATRNDAYKKYLQATSQKGKEKKETYPEMIRKGLIGDWRNLFSEDQSRRMDEHFEAKMKNLRFSFGWTKDMLYKKN
ncbi:sulfotransferase 1E1-like isoform X2 [Argiope bruennichi]|uniref:sulfotransferase 1E1-like isoform X2 n=1 Tax=Argiope bruennichi TaxID=94029 RepID=UPI00249581B7|nr:sulfotransferase 1E1-like isoform X2 [Argiope bruennichi]